MSSHEWRDPLHWRGDMCQGACEACVDAI